MERNKWEEEFNEKLNQREITPAPHAWDRLDAMLNEADSHKAPIAIDRQNNTRKLTWLYIAAGIAAMVMIATVFFKQEKDQQRNEIVNEEMPKTPVELVSPKIKSVQEQSPTQQPQVAEQTAPNQSMSTQKQFRFNQVSPSNAPVENQAVAQQDNQKPAHENGINAPEQEINNVGNDNQQIASTGTKMQQPKSVKVDPRSLLSQVDGELDLTFREKTIKTINKKYQNVKVALANRNNQE